ncbi:MAG: GNAT family N-acetyltransferase [Cyclobacteriaceae bacterium]
MSRSYKCMPGDEFGNDKFKLIPIRDIDKYSIMQWRNEQIDVLRQEKILTKENQDKYFKNVVDKLFEQDNPNQLLFSFFEKDVLIGYGGLVHIDWVNKNAEVSFLTETIRNKAQGQIITDWKNFLITLIKVISLHLNLIKVYTYAFDLRPFLYSAFIESGFIEEARLKKHVVVAGNTHDVVIHSCFLKCIMFRMAEQGDMSLYFDWANDKEVRANSYHPGEIDPESHRKWFHDKIAAPSCTMYMFSTFDKIPVGQVRIESFDDEIIIGISIDKGHRGQGLSTKMLLMATNHYFELNPDKEIVAYIKTENVSSYKSFIAAGFIEGKMLDVMGIESYKLVKHL